MRLSISALILATLTACGGGGGDSTESESVAPETSAPAESSEAATTAAAELQTMREACPAVESALPEVDATADEWAAFITTVDELSASSDLETQNALELLRPGAESAQRIAEEGGLPIEAEMNVSDSVTAFAERCKAAGSSALQ